MLYYQVPTSHTLPVLIGVPHAGTEIPPECAESFVSPDPLLLTRDSDLFVDELYQSAPSHGVSLLSTSVCRYVIDCNRNPNNVDASFVLGAPVVAHPKHLGLVAHKTVAGEKLLKRPLTRVELDYRIKNYHAPFHEKTNATLEGLKKQFGYCINLEGHSMPSQGSAGHIDDGKSRADVVLGDLDGTSCSPKLTDFLESHFKSHGLTVSRNYPYKGAYVTALYGKPMEGSHSILIELNRKLYMDETSHQKLAGKFEDLQKMLFSMILQLRKLSLL